ncbi:MULTISPECIES: hypothetical protein [unclassified Coleofasciculus]|uniref:hypothetical protein n=1 Tax=unclassified Coleofasciculus TaxID=2692782 RepID=UPI001881D683|nr:MULTISPECIES: hypothetical protein [unclassified Coleofasciculus]MBE9129716.1 hypothetical protein [Coleofasciculus sp. LEGE 07081]MBE9151086.1 hypothetical protein [Coleofasciculus sp. LEGE 07092]
MKDKTIFEPGYASNSNGIQALRLIKISLLILLLGTSVVGKRKSTWPLVAWALYSGYSARFRPPEPSVSAIELRVYTTTGDLHVVKPEQVLTIPRDSLSHKIVEQAFDDADIGLRNASRRYLMRAVSNLVRTNSEIKTIQAWNLSYQVEPLAVPPIQLQAPTSEVMLDSFSREDIAEKD